MILQILVRFCVLFLILCVKCGSCEISNDLETRSIFYGFALTAANRNTAGSICEKQLATLEKGIRNLDRWAIKLMDASGAPTTGLYWGNTFWLGSKKQCLNSMSTKQIAVTTQVGPITLETPDSIPPFLVDYYAAYFHHNSTMQVLRHARNETTITLGLCIPTSCQESEIRSLLQEYFDSAVFYHQTLYGMSLQLEGVKKVLDDYSWIYSTKIFVALVFIGTFIIMCLVGTGYDVLICRSLMKTKEKNETEMEMEIQGLPPNNNLNINNHGLNPQFKPPDSRVKSTKIVLSSRILLCFSLRVNTNDIFFGKNTNKLQAIEGIRAFTTAYVVFVHAMSFMNDHVDNGVGILYIADNAISKIVGNAKYAVDTFFTISGFLVAHLLLKEFSKKSSDVSFLNKFTSFLMRVIKRFLRLTPAYMATLCITDMIATWRYRNTAFWSGENNDVLCSKYWWRNLLYINNFYPVSEMCMFWSWYLSNDMQFFILSTALLLLSLSYFRLAVGIFGSIVTASCLYTAYILYSTNFIPIFDMIGATLDLLYTPPWARIGPYMVGLAAGYILFFLKGKLYINKYALWSLWVFGIFLNLAMLFGIPDRSFTLAATILYLTFGKYLWAVGNAWIIIACVTNNGGWFQKFLSLKCWVPFSKMSYCAYLINPTLIFAITTMNEKAWQLEVSTMLLFGVSYIVLSFFCAYIISVFIEFPIIGLVKIFTAPVSKNPSADAEPGVEQASHLQQ